METRIILPLFLFLVLFYLSVSKEPGINGSMTLFLGISVLSFSKSLLLVLLRNHPLPLQIWPSTKPKPSARRYFQNSEKRFCITRMAQKNNACQRFTIFCFCLLLADCDCLLLRALSPLQWLIAYPKHILLKSLGFSIIDCYSGIWVASLQGSLLHSICLLMASG